MVIKYHLFTIFVVFDVWVTACRREDVYKLQFFSHLYYYYLSLHVQGAAKKSNPLSSFANF